MKVQPAAALFGAENAEVQTGNHTLVSKGKLETTTSLEGRLEEAEKKNKLLHEECKDLRQQLWDLHKKLRTNSGQKKKKVAIYDGDGGHDEELALISGSPLLSSFRQRPERPASLSPKPERWVWGRGCA